MTKYIKLKCSIIFTIILCLCSKGIKAQTITVLEEGTNQPVSGVSLYNLKKTKYEVTDFDGNANLNKFNDREVIYFKNLLYEPFQLRKLEISKNNYTVYLTPKVEGLKQIVISVSKFEQSKKDIPQSIVAVNAKEIVFANPQTSADLLDNTP